MLLSVLGWPRRHSDYCHRICKQDSFCCYQFHQMSRKFNSQPKATIKDKGSHHKKKTEKFGKNSLMGGGLIFFQKSLIFPMGRGGQAYLGIFPKFFRFFL